MGSRRVDMYSPAAGRGSRPRIAWTRDLRGRLRVPAARHPRADRRRGGLLATTDRDRAQELLVVDPSTIAGPPSTIER